MPKSPRYPFYANLPGGVIHRIAMTSKARKLRRWQVVALAVRELPVRAKPTAV